MRTDEKMVHLVIRLRPSVRRGINTEGLWAERVAGGRLRLRNTPFFAPGLSMDDVVFAERRRGLLECVGVSLRGGHSTYWIATAKGRASWEAYWARLESLGCSCERTRLGGDRVALAVDVPPYAKIDLVLGILEEGASAGAWDYDEGHRGHP